MKFQTVKGMKDILPGEVETWQIFEAKTRRFLEGYGFREIRTPVLESTELLMQSIGEASDIVHKEMYTFQDRGGRSLTMRPEMTASVVRSVIEHHLIKDHQPLFLYYIGSMYRAERPQAGRKREFYQVGVETLNTHSSINDAELMIMVSTYLKSFGLSKFEMRLNNLGTDQDRKHFSDRLVKFFQSHQAELCDDCKFRLSKNVLRIFDCKVHSCQPIIQKAPNIERSKESDDDFERIQKLLREAKVPFRIDPKLVRGLDYYTGCVYEVTAEGLGAQDAILAGGRYDGLIQALGGPSVGASGFALGVERFLTALEAHGVTLKDEVLRDRVYVAAMVHGEGTCFYYRQIAEGLVKAGKQAEFGMSEKSIASHLKHANKLQVGYALLVGEDEIQKGEVSVKNMTTGKQRKVSVSELAGAFE